MLGNQWPEHVEEVSLHGREVGIRAFLVLFAALALVLFLLFGRLLAI